MNSAILKWAAEGNLSAWKLSALSSAWNEIMWQSNLFSVEWNYVTAQSLSAWNEIMWQPSVEWNHVTAEVFFFSMEWEVFYFCNAGNFCGEYQRENIFFCFPFIPPQHVDRSSPAFIPRLSNLNIKLWAFFVWLPSSTYGCSLWLSLFGCCVKATTIALYWLLPTTNHIYMETYTPSFSFWLNRWCSV